MIKELSESYLNLFILVYGASFFVLPIVIAAKQKEIAHFNLTNGFWYLAGFGLLHDITDLMPLAHRLLVLPDGHVRILSVTKLLLDMFSYFFLAVFGFSVITETNFRRSALWTFSPVLAATVYLVSTNIFSNKVSDAYGVTSYFLAAPTALLAAFGFTKLGMRFHSIDMNSLARYFFALAACFSFFAVLKFFPSYVAFGVPSPNGVPIIMARSLTAFTAALLIIRILKAFEV